MEGSGEGGVIGSFDGLSVVYAWGNGDDGRLGHGDTERRWVPTIVDALSRVDVVDVIASETHTLALSNAIETDEMYESRKEAQSKKASARRETKAIAPAKAPRAPLTGTAGSPKMAIGKHGGPRIN
jgi:hypothetical protein